jgi:hypothetical protein
LLQQENELSAQHIVLCEDEMTNAAKNLNEFVEA